MNNYLWRFFSKRAINPKASFEQEYLTVSDMWLSEADDPHSGRKIQEVHRDHLLAIKMDPEGYVYTHQHFSHSHDHGWPFPMWVHIHGGHQGYTNGWHFQDKIAGWIGQHRLLPENSPNRGQAAADSWKVQNLESGGIQNGAWQLKTTGISPEIFSSENIDLTSFTCPYIQIRWNRSEEAPPFQLPYMEWKREGDQEFTAERRFYYEPVKEEHSSMTGMHHSMIPVYRHPLWNGQIKQIKFALAPGESDVEFSIDSIFTHFDTRHSINNPFLILASWEYFRWTGDIDFLRKNMNRLRKALRYQQTEMGGLRYNHIRNTWPGHDGLPGWTKNPDGSKTIHPGHGIGNNYWDLMPFGWDDFYATSQYYKATKVMAQLEKLIQENSGWGVPAGADSFEPEFLLEHARKVKKTANKKFWNRKAGRFIASIDKNGNPHDYGYTFVNLEAAWYGIASDSHAEKFMEWITGKRIVAGDTSTGEDIYYWRFGPRATTRRNEEWYGQVWTAPETIPWGGQVQDGGAVLGFTFFDLWARLNILGPDNAWNRLKEILEWESEVQKAGGYRAYYAEGKQGGTLQGGGTAGGLGIDHEFLESSLLPAIVPHGFLGLNPNGKQLEIHPKPPKDCPRMGIQDLLFRNVRMDIVASENSIKVSLKEDPVDPIWISLIGDWKSESTSETGSDFQLSTSGQYHFKKK